MNRIGWAVLALLAVAACKDKPSMQLKEAPDPALQPPKAPEWALTLPMLDGYLKYQRTLLVQAGKLPAPAWDGGGLKAFEEPTIAQKASADERARAEAGLSPDDVEKIENLLASVASKRMTARVMGISEKDVPPPIDPTLDPQMQEVQAAQASIRARMLDLPEERKTFGSANVDVLLKREDELIKNWALMLEVPELAEKRK